MTICPKCGYVEIRRTRTTGPQSQNHHLNGHVRQIAMETGEEFEIVKREIKRRARKRGYPFKTSRFGYAVPKSEAEATVSECAMLIDEAHEIAAWLNIALREENG